MNTYYTKIETPTHGNGQTSSKMKFETWGALDHYLNENPASNVQEISEKEYYTSPVK